MQLVALSIVKDKVEFNSFVDELNQLSAKYQCSPIEYPIVYAATYAVLQIEKGIGEQKLLEQILSDKSLSFINNNLLEMNSIDSFNSRILCVKRDSAIVLRVKIEKKSKREDAKAWIMIDQYNFSFENHTPKLEIPNTVIQKYWFSMSKNLNLIYFSKLSYPYEVD